METGDPGDSGRCGRGKRKGVVEVGAIRDGDITDPAGTTKNSGHALTSVRLVFHADTDTTAVV